jgi:IclR family transcriptional regulator, pca regulon regulatory protein
MARLREADAARRAADDRGPDFSEALARGLKIIQAFDAETRAMTLSDIARRVDLPRATARRALVTLAALEFVETDGRLFRLTPRILTLAGAYLNSNPITTILQPACERLARTLQESCSAAVLDGADIVMIAHAAPQRLMASGAGVGFRLPAFCTSLGRVLLSALPDERLEAFLKALRPTALTPQTDTDKAALRRAIAAARAQDHALVDQEAELGFRSIAVPVRRFDGAVVVAINVGVHIQRASLERMRGEFLPVLLAEAEELRTQLF